MEAYLPLLLVVIGWLVVNSQHNRRETRKEGRALIDAAKKLVQEIAKNAVAYHCDGKDDVAFDIKASLEALEIELERTPHFFKVSPLMYKFVKFSEAVTGGQFESASREKLPVTAPLILDILRSRNVLLSELERQFKVHYL